MFPTDLPRAVLNSEKENIKTEFCSPFCLFVCILFLKESRVIIIKIS